MQERQAASRTAQRAKRAARKRRDEAEQSLPACNGSKYCGLAGFVQGLSLSEAIYLYSLYRTLDAVILVRNICDWGASLHRCTKTYVIEASRMLSLGRRKPLDCTVEWPSL